MHHQHYIQPSAKLTLDYDFEQDQTQYNINVHRPLQNTFSPCQPSTRNSYFNNSFFKATSTIPYNFLNSNSSSLPYNAVDLEMSKPTTYHARHSSTSSTTSVSSSAGSHITSPTSNYSLSPSSSIINAFPNGRTTGSSAAADNTITSAAETAPSESLTAPSPSRPKKRMRQSSNYYSNITNMVCLFWFNDYSTLEAAFERAKTCSFGVKGATTLDPSILAPLSFSRLTTPTNSFKQFIMNVLKHTQLPPTAISLALFYILRLKQLAIRPIVGNANSEYRVFSVALMLANKFLDDNTYTNKTWSEVTHLPLKEISAMEVEFLANLRYTLYVESADWIAWQQRLRVWLNIHSSVCLSFQNPAPMALPVLPVVPAAAPTSVPTSTPAAAFSYTPQQLYSQPNSPTTVRNKRYLDDINTCSLPPAKKPALVSTVLSPGVSPSFQELPSLENEIIAATRLTSSPYAPMYPVQTLLAQTQFPCGFNSNASSSTSSPVVGGGYAISQQQLPQPEQQQGLVRPQLPVYYYTLTDQKYKLNPSPHCGFLPVAAASQTQSPQYHQFDLEHYRAAMAFDPLFPSIVPQHQHQQQQQQQLVQQQLQQQQQQAQLSFTKYPSPLGSSPLHSAWNPIPYSNPQQRPTAYF